MIYPVEAILFLCLVLEVYSVGFVVLVAEEALALVQNQTLP